MDLDTVKLTQEQFENLKDNGFCNVEIEKGKMERIVIHGLFTNTNDRIHEKAEKE